MTHARTVSVRDVDFPLTESRIREEVPGRRVYHLTGTLVLRHDGDHAVVDVDLDGRGVLRTVASVDVVALPEATAVVDDDRIDVFNPSQMARVHADRDAEAVVVHGRYGYTNVARSGEAAPVRIVDVVPPADARLLAMAEALLEADPPPTPLRLASDPIDAEAIADKAEQPVVLPCFSDAAGPVLLDDAPELTDDEAAEATLVGCELSKRIYRDLYGVEPELVDICPANREGGPAIARCCMVDEVEEDGDKIVVPWGASHAEVRQALHLVAAKQDGGAGGDGDGRDGLEAG